MNQITLKDGITLLSGVCFDYTNPEACEIVSIEDIARPLSNICRFAGQMPWFYSVAQHAVNTSYIVPDEFAYTALMHDTAEAFTNDITTPLKVAVPLFKEIEIKIEHDMSRRFGFQFPLPPEVKMADLQMLALEMEGIRGQNAADWKHLNGVQFEHLREAVDLTSWSPADARTRFLERYYEVCP